MIPPGKIGLQLYTVRDLMARDVPGTLAEVAAIGYRELEFAGYFDHEPGRIADLLAVNGLKAPSTHAPLDAFQTRLDSLIETAQLIGHRHLVLPWLLPDQRQSLQQYAEIAKLLNEAGKACQGAGIAVGYHNHDFEFEAIDGKLPIDLLLEETDPDLVKIELDLYWITKAGYSAQDYFSKHPGRFNQVHVKDLAASGEITEVGSGTIAFGQVLTAARSAGVEHFYVEHDHPADALVSIKTSFSALVNGHP